MLNKVKLLESYQVKSPKSNVKSQSCICRGNFVINVTGKNIIIQFLIAFKTFCSQHDILQNELALLQINLLNQNNPNVYCLLQDYNNSLIFI